MEKKGKRESNRQNTKKNERRLGGKNKMSEKTTLRNDKWERKQYIKNCESNTIKEDVIKIRLHMWNTKCNYERNESDTTCPLCKTEGDTTVHIMVRQEGVIHIIYWMK